MCMHFTELISNTGVLLQSEFLLFLEDSTWTVHASVMTVLTYSRNLAKMSFFLLFAVALIVLHLPRRFKLLFENPNRFACEPLFFTCGVFKKQGKIIVQACHHEVCTKQFELTNSTKHCVFVWCVQEKAWVIPMMLGQAVMTPIMFIAINGGLGKGASLMGLLRFLF